MKEGQEKTTMKPIQRSSAQKANSRENERKQRKVLREWICYNAVLDVCVCVVYIKPLSTSNPHLFFVESFYCRKCNNRFHLRAHAFIMSQRSHHSHGSHFTFFNSDFTCTHLLSYEVCTKAGDKLKNGCDLTLKFSHRKTMNADDARGDQRCWFEFKGQRTKGNIFTFDCTNSV